MCEVALKGGARGRSEWNGGRDGTVVASREPLTMDERGRRTGSLDVSRARAMDNKSKHLTTLETRPPQFKHEEVANTNKPHCSHPRTRIKAQAPDRNFHHIHARSISRFAAFLAINLASISVSIHDCFAA